MKRGLQILSVIILMICVLNVIAYVIGLRINHVSNKNAPARLYYTNADNISVCSAELLQSEKEQVIKVVDGKVTFPDSPSCPFSMSMSIEIAGTYYLPALDDCCLVQVGNTGRYIRINEKEKHLLMKIISNYSSRTGDGLREPY